MIQNFKFVFIDLGLGYLHVLQCQYKKKNQLNTGPKQNLFWARCGVGPSVNKQIH